MSTPNYRIIVAWSDEDEAFLAYAPDLRGCVSHGGTREEALFNVELMIGEWLISAEQLGWEIPKPLSHQEQEAQAIQVEKARREAFADAVQKAVQQVVNDIMPKLLAAVEQSLPKPQQGAPCGPDDDDGYEGYLPPTPWRG